MRSSEALAKAFADESVDSVVTCFIPPLVTPDEDVATAVREAALTSESRARLLGMRGVSTGCPALRTTRLAA